MTFLTVLKICSVGYLKYCHLSLIIQLHCIAGSGRGRERPRAAGRADEAREAVRVGGRHGHSRQPLPLGQIQGLDSIEFHKNIFLKLELKCGF